MVNANPFTNAFVIFVVILIVVGIMLGGKFSDILNSSPNTARAAQIKPQPSQPAGGEQGEAVEENPAVEDNDDAENQWQEQLGNAQTANELEVMEAEKENELEVMGAQKAATIENIHQDIWEKNEQRKEALRVEREENNLRIEKARLWTETFTTIAKYFGLGVSAILIYGLARTVHHWAGNFSAPKKPSSLPYRIPAYKNRKVQEAKAREQAEIARKRKEKISQVFILDSKYPQQQSNLHWYTKGD